MSGVVLIVLPIDSYISTGFAQGTDVLGNLQALNLMPFDWIVIDIIITNNNKQQG